MRKVKRSSGGTITVIQPGEERPPGEICFTEDEYAWAVKVSSNFRTDPEFLKGFWFDLLKEKEADPLYDYLQAYPREGAVLPEPEIAPVVKLEPGQRPKTIDEICEFNKRRLMATGR